MTSTDLFQHELAYVNCGKRNYGTVSFSDHPNCYSCNHLQEQIQEALLLKKLQQQIAFTYSGNI